jgi:hypothetical protein
MTKKLSSKKLIVLSFVGLVLLISAIVVAVLYNPNRVHYVTTYEDAGGWVYHCSKPVAAKDQGATYMSGATSYTPIDPAEAAQYCKRLGIE